MGLLAEIYTVFGLGYSIALVKLKHNDFSRSDKAFIVATVAFLVLSIGRFFKQLSVIPSGYKWRFTGKSLLRGLLGPLLSLLHYPVLFGCSDCVKKALTFSNEAQDGVEWTRQLKIFELVELGSRARRYLTTHSLLWYGKEKKWGYARLVGEIWVQVRFEAQFNVDTSRKLQTSDLGMKLLLQYERDTDSQQGPESILEVNTGSVNVPKAKQESVKVSCLDCVCVDLESGSNHANLGTPRTLPATSQNLPTPPIPLTPPTPPTPPTSQNHPTPQLPPTSQNPTTLVTSPTPQPPPTSQNPTTPTTSPTPQLPPTSQNPTTPVTSPTPQPPPTSQNSTTPTTSPTSQNPTTPTTSPTPQPPPTSQYPPEQYAVTITRRRAIYRIRRGECWLCPGWTWNLSSTQVRNWTLFQIHQYMLCLDVWGNHPKQGIWKTHEPKTCCSGDICCCNAFTRIKRTLFSYLPGQRSTNQPTNNQASKKIRFRYCYRHDELIDAIDNNRRLKQRENDGTRYTVV